MNDAHYTTLIGKYLSGNISPAERHLLLNWIETDANNRAFFEEMLQVWSLSDDYPTTPTTTDTPQAWLQLEQRLFGGGTARMNPPADKSSTKIRRLSINKVILLAAAIILAVVTMGIWQLVGFSDAATQIYQTAAHEKREVQLPDGSTVWLNENTRLTFSKRFVPRTLNLEGEAFFDVQRMEARPFTIQSGKAITVVLGTSFNVRAYPKEARVEVAVVSGKVELRRADKVQEKVLLEAGKTGVFDQQRQALLTAETPAANASAWKNKRLRFQDTPMREVVHILERYFNQKIQVDNPAILDCPLNGDYPQPKLEEMLRIIEFAMPVQITVQSDSLLVITGKGCQ
ncbi:MAG TPA: FecR domain-containing protein [Saprospiraceae bacterium]|nr:FecR domain-containing protein [Saprospiraceae bacterium]HMP14050.1 FecR domain-containing protein [Saprospiraceae bacterium]